VAGSHDVKDAKATPEMIVKAAINEGLKIIAVADHNEITGCRTSGFCRYRG
jgi:predicted metal-dependent phosphoesterase TrpH